MMNAEATRSPTLGTRLRDVVFFILFFLYLRLVVDVRLIAHCAGPRSGDLPVFYRGWTFFREFVVRPGGLVEYAGAFLFQLFSHAWLGALVVTCLAWLLSLCVSGCFAASGSQRLRCLRHVPAVLLLAIYSRYAHCITSIVALLAALCLLPAYLRISAKGTAAAMAFFIVVCPALYCIAGATCVVFAATCILYEALIMRRWQLAAPCLLVAGAVPWAIGVLLCGSPPAAALTPYAFSWNVAIPGEPLWAIYVLYLLVPAGMILSSGSWAAAHRVRPWEALLPFVLAAGTAYFAFAPGGKALRTVDFYASRGKWEQVLAAARADPANPPIVQTVDRALCHTGRMADELFSHPQSLPALLIDPNEPLSWQWAEIWLDVGFVNAAEHHLAQAEEVVGEQPAILQKLALIHMAKGNIGTAKIYLKALTRTLFRDEWAVTHLKELEDDPNLSNDPQVQWLRGTMPKTSALIKEQTTDEWFLELLDTNPTNRLAFEYLMALYLVAGRPDKVAETIHRLDTFGCARPYLPEHYAEAVVAYMAKGGKPDLYGWQIREETLQRFQACMESARTHQNDPAALRRELRETFPGSYFRYLLVGESGRP